jgi:hypothetical protein
MMFLWLSILMLLQACLSSAHGNYNVPKPVQLCQVNYGRKTDACLAATSNTNISTNTKDLQLHLSVRFFDEREGWAAYGIGEKMDSALMFVMYPGVEDEGQWPLIYIYFMRSRTNIACRGHCQCSVDFVSYENWKGN